MSKQPNFFDPLPSETIIGKIGANPFSSESRARTKAFEDYYTAISRLDSKISDFRIYNADGVIAGWVEAHQIRIDTLDTARAAFYEQLRLFTGDTRPPRPSLHSDPAPALDKLERWPGETPEEHEYRLFRDFGIRIPEKTDPLDTAFFLPKPPDMTLELLTHIRDLLSQLVASQARPAGNLTNISQTLADDPAKLWESLKGVDKKTFRKKLFGEIAEGSEHLDVRGPQSVGHPGELDQRIGQDRDLLDEAVDDLLRRRGLSGHPLAQRFSRLLDDAIEIFANLIRESHDETSPSVDGCGDPTVGDGPVAGVKEEAPATAGTDTPVGIDTSPLVVARTASLQDAISARDDVFFRIRNIAAQPPSEFAYEQLPMLVEELRVEQLQVQRCTTQLEHARAAEVSRSEAGIFSNRRRSGARFSNPISPATPETPDTAQ